MKFQFSFSQYKLLKDGRFEANLHIHNSNLSGNAEIESCDRALPRRLLNLSTLTIFSGAGSDDMLY